MKVEYRDRVFVTGISDGGKSTLARAVFLSAAEPKIVVDPTDSEITDVPGAVTFRDVDELDLSLPLTRFVPQHPNDAETWDELYRKIFETGGPRYTWTDEGRFPFPANGTKPWPATFHITGRKRELGHLVCNTRSIGVNLECIGLAQHIFGFEQGHPEDKAVIAKAIGVPGNVLDEVYAQLQPFGFFHFSRRAREVRICPPLELGARP